MLQWIILMMSETFLIQHNEHTIRKETFSWVQASLNSEIYILIISIHIGNLSRYKLQFYLGKLQKSMNKTFFIIFL